LVVHKQYHKFKDGMKGQYVEVKMCKSSGKVVLIWDGYFMRAVPRYTMESSVIKPKETYSPAKHHLVLVKKLLEGLARVLRLL
jgi:hypothetical protein